MKKNIIYCLFLTILFLSCEKDNITTPTQTIKNISIDSLKVITTNLPKASYTDLTFLNSNTGFAVAQGIIVKTNDGGLNWNAYTEMNINTALKKIQFIDSKIGYTFGNNGDNGVLLKTTNAGLTWNNINYGGTEYLNGMFFINKDVGFLVGNNIFCKTTNGGLTWTNIKSPEYQIFNDINFKNNSEGIVTSNNGVYLETKNSGVSWNFQQTKRVDNLGTIYFTENKILVNISSDSLLNLSNPFEVVNKPANAYKLLFINSKQTIGIGNHYEVGFWPSGDIMISNDFLNNFAQKSYTPVKAIDFKAITKMDDHKIMIIGLGFENPLVVTLNF